ncbi:expressed protein [Phakopsora pachyrhizi]|uniref:Expressed protein n=1 Tax=Phakopsora pachyrhizi TaxID=170000 RepID=A0AAV0B5I8_PHAPC|nr:expressed protein [Phakopsora pachyrhizi]
MDCNNTNGEGKEEEGSSVRTCGNRSEGCLNSGSMRCRWLLCKRCCKLKTEKRVKERINQSLKRSVVEEKGDVEGFLKTEENGIKQVEKVNIKTEVVVDDDDDDNYCKSHQARDKLEFDRKVFKIEKRRKKNLMIDEIKQRKSKKICST